MSVLDDIPYHDGGYQAFGFFTTKEMDILLIRSCARAGRTKKELRKYYNRILKMKTAAMKTAAFWNGLVLLGYIPVAGVFTGVFKIWLAIPTELSKTHKSFSVRGITEI